MSYQLDIAPDAQEDLAALPPLALRVVAEAFTVLSLVPLNGQPYNVELPDRPLRTLTFDDGRGLITYLIAEDFGRVDVLQISWLP